MKKFVWIAILTLLMCACGEAPSDAVELEEILVEGPAPGFSGKADEAAIAMVALDFVVPLAAREQETRRTITTEAAFRRTLGASSPNIDWNKHWAFFYTTGALAQSGHEASVVSIRLAQSTKSIQITTRHTSPGPACDTAASNALAMAPALVVLFAKPSIDPRGMRYYTADNVRDCAPDSCAEQLDAFDEPTDSLWFTSESDFLFDKEYFDGSAQASWEGVESALLQRAQPLEQLSFDAFFARLTTEQEWMEDEQLEDVRRYRELEAVLRSQLKDLRVYRVGEIEIHVYILGITDCGDVGGLHTVSIET
ncbi:MAG: nuclease A inhibitor family protein [Bradymonadaceae bacterium]|nr:nuclease A inhibitor family protein [Lujinxingiaceae bacterium]